MSTKYTKPDISPSSPNMMYRSNIPEDFTLPSCGIEDVDRAVFKLFNEQIPLFYKIKDNTEKIPVIFATGERAFILRRNKPITDNNGALILPLVSILRTGLDQAPAAGGFGVGPGNGTMEISRRTYVDSMDVLQEQNFEGLLGIHQKYLQERGSFSQQKIFVGYEEFNAALEQIKQELAAVAIVAEPVVAKG